MGSLRIAVVSALLASLALATSARSHDDSPGTRGQNSGVQPEKIPTEEQQDHAIKVRVNEVVAPVTVLDSKGEMIFDLTKEKFHIFDNGVEQEIEHFDLGGDQLAVALVIETSSHIKAMAPVIRNIGSIFTETVMALNGEAAVITYDSTVNVRQPFTQDHDAIEHAIRNVDFEAPEMRLYDALGSAVGLLKAQPTNFRRVILIVGESQDHSSESKLGLVLRDIQLANITIYAVGPSSTAADMRYGTEGLSGGKKLPPITLSKHLPPVSTRDPGTDPRGHPYVDFLTPAIWLLTRGTNEIRNHQIEIVVAATGGTHYRTLSNRAVQTALDRIGGEIHAQYILGYTLRTEGTPGFHEIKVTVARPKVSVRTRPGYFLDKPPASLQ